MKLNESELRSSMETLQVHEISKRSSNNKGIMLNMEMEANIFPFSHFHV